MTEPRSWEAPGPGSWSLVADHYPRPVTAMAAGLCEVWSVESTGYMQRLGLPIESATMATVNGLPYVAIGGGGGGSKAPPAWLLSLLVRVLPSLRRAEKRLGQLLQERPWNEAVARWYDHDRSLAEESLRRFAAVDPTALDDAALAEHLVAAERQAQQRMREHLRLHEHDTLPPGLFVAQAIRWGIEATTAFDLLRGASPASTGQSPSIDRLRSAVAGRSASSVEELRALGDDVAAALDEVLEQHGWRVLDGYDIDCVCLAEVPELLVRLATATGRAVSAPDDEAARRAREQVPTEARPEFDRLLEEGRAAYGPRDDNSALLVCWPIGLARRAWLAAGHRLHEQGRLPDPSLAIEATSEELARALRDGAAAPVADLQARAQHRRGLRAADAPATLGPPEPPMPTGVGGLLGLVFEVFSVYELSGAPDRPALAGLGIGETAYTGVARLVPGADAAAIAAFQPGEVLVAPMTSPSYNVLLSLAGALVTDEGAAFSHAAIMARELGLPAVVGAIDATRRISDGDLVTVDPIGGRATVVSSATPAAAEARV